MPQPTCKFQDPRVCLTELRERELIDDELFHSLMFQLNCSSTGRAFGHRSAIDLSELIGDLCNRCRELEVSNQDSVRSIFDRVLNPVKKQRTRKITPVNSLLREVANELACLSDEPTVSLSSNPKPAAHRGLRPLMR
jgi:hypothetical protein